MCVDIVIVNWNSGHLLQDCVESILKNRGTLVSNIIVVDNNSDDVSINFLKELSDVHLIRAEKNLGFGRACNLGAMHSKSKYVLFLNPDARIYSSTLSKVVDFMNAEENSKIGICGVQLHNNQGKVARSSSRFPSFKHIFSHSVGLTKIFPSFGSAMKDWNHENTLVVDQVIGAFFFVRQCIFLDLKGFDEQFFVYFEEVDFSLRAKNLGWDSIFYADAQAFHVGGAISQQVKSKRLFYTLRSRIQYSYKHFSPLEVFGVLLSTLLIEPITRMVLSIANKSLISAKETLLAYLMLYKWMIFKKRYDY